MPADEQAAHWTTVAPTTWPEPPEEMTVSTLKEIETCPRRWALASADYPELWTGRGYPPRLQLSSLAGTVVHLTLETIVRKLVGAACSSVQDPTAPQVMKELGGYSKVVSDCIDRVVGWFAQNPRALRLLEHAVRSLRAQVPDLRTRVQALLARVRLPAATVTAGAGIDRKRRPLLVGAHPEVELRARQIGWKGKADLLLLSLEACEILDFKTGSRGGEHVFQVRVYALLWSRDTELNPKRRLTDKLTVAYNGGDIEVPALSAAELDDLEREIVARGDAARKALAERPPKAQPSVEACRYCWVRQLCDVYWAAETQCSLAGGGLEARFTDLEVVITGRHGPLSWDAVVEVSRNLPTGARIVLRAGHGDLDFRSGERLRILDVLLAVDKDSQAQPTVVTMGTVSEAFAVTRPGAEA